MNFIFQYFLHFHLLKSKILKIGKILLNNFKKRYIDSSDRLDLVIIFIFKPNRISELNFLENFAIQLNREIIINEKNRLYYAFYSLEKFI